VEYLAQSRARLQAEPGGPHRLTFSREALAEVREAFERMIRQGERRLHRLTSLLCEAYLRGRYELESVVVAEVDGTRERLVLSQVISASELDLFTDLDLGNRQVSKLRWSDGQVFRRARLVANFLEYQPFATRPHGIVKVTSRIKAEEEIWNKVVDEIFDLDALVKRDKKLRKLSRYVKDVFGLKIVADTRKRVEGLQRQLHEVEFSDALLESLGILPDPQTRRLQFIEVKDYLASTEQKRSGWSAVKSVVRWRGQLFEIQVQPLANYLRERERLTRESHASFKARREALRDEIARAVPLFGFYRDLLQWLFGSRERPAQLPGVEIELKD
jgi:Region found in RelA / SpoT proteins